MTVSSATAKIRHAGNSATYQFTTSFTFLANSHVRVILLDATGTETEWTEGTEYSLTGANTGAAGTVTVDLSPVDYTPATGETLVIMRDVPFVQDLDATVLATLAASEIETALDKCWQALGQLKEKLDRAVVSDDSAVSGTAPAVAAWSPVFAIVTDGDRRVQQVANWVGGIGAMPTIGEYVGAGGLVAAIGDAVDIRGPAGASGAGTGDMLAANNLSEVTPATARTNLELGTMAVEAAADYLTKAGNLAGLADAPTARTSLGLGTAAVVALTDLHQVVDNLSQLADASAARSNLGLGTAAVFNVGTAASNIVQLSTAPAKLPAVDGSLLTNLPSTGQPTPASSTYAVGTMLLAAINDSTSVTDGSTIAGSKLARLIYDSPTGLVYGGAVLTGTWKNVSGQTLSTVVVVGGYWVRTA